MDEPAPLELEVLVGSAAFGDRHEWNDLVARSVGGSFFQTAQWCAAWSEHLACPDELAVGRVRQEGRLVGGGALAALSIPVLTRLGLAVPSVTNAGSGPGAADHAGFPILSDAPASALNLLWDWVLHWHPRRSMLLANLDRDTSLAAVASEEFQPVDEEHCPIAIVEKGASFDDVRASWTKNRRKTIGKRLREFADQGGRFSWITEPEEIVTALPTVFRLHALRRGELGRTTTFGASSENRAFHTTLASYADGVSGCWVQLATVGNDVVGALYGFRLGETYSVYQSGWHPSWSSSSLGLIQYAEAFRHTVESGGERFDMCRGTDAYKLRFATDVLVERSYFRPRGAAGLLLTARWAARRARRRRSRQTSGASPEVD